MNGRHSYDPIFLQLLSIARLEDMQADILSIEDRTEDPARKTKMLRALTLLLAARKILEKDLINLDEGGEL